MRHLANRLGLCFLIVFLASLPVWGQAAATLSGTVSDPTGAVVPGASVKLTNPATAVVRQVTTAGDGTYVLTQLPPATYRLEVSSPGFTTHRREIRVAVATAQSVDVELEVGAVAEVVEVTGEAVLQKTDASMGSPFSAEAVQSLPMLDRNPAGLLSLQAAVAYVPANTIASGMVTGDPDDDGRSGAVAGARSDQTNVTLDGVDVNDAQYGYAFQSVLRTTLASLQEFRVTTNNYNADLGRSSAAQVSLVTKSGTNDVHGSAYYLQRNEALAANDFFLNRAGEDKPKLRRHVFGASLGGPIVKDRFFLFGNFEQLREKKAETVLRAVPSMSLRDGILIYECDDPAACPGNSATGLVTGQPHTADPGFYALSPAELAAIDPLGLGPNTLVLDYWNQYVEPNDPGEFDEVNILGYRFASPVKNVFSTGILRADINLDTQGKHIVYWRGNWQDDSFNNPPQFPGEQPRQSLLSSNKGFGVGYTAVLRPTLVNNFRMGLTRIQESFGGLQDRPHIDFRFIDEFDAYMTNTFGRRLPLWNFRDDLSWTKGSHTFTFGADIRILRNKTFTNANSYHFYSTNPSWLPNVSDALRPGSARCTEPGCAAVPASAYGFRSAYRDTVTNLLGILTQATGYFNLTPDGTLLSEGTFLRRKWGVDEYEFYLQDQWRMTPTLTWTLGLRYTLASPPRELNGLQVSPVFGGSAAGLNGLGDWFNLRGADMRQGIPASLAPDVGFDLSGPANGQPNFYAWDKNNWSPRIALAWAPRSLGAFSGEGKLVIRAGYGLVYDRMGNGLVTLFDSEGSFGLSSVLDSTFAGCDEGTGRSLSGLPCARFTGIFDTAGVEATSLPPQPCTGFPCFFPGADPTGIGELGSFAITSALDANLKTPYAHVLNFSISRELPWNLTVEGSFIGRYGHGLLIMRDVAMPYDLCDPVSGRCYFQSARDMLTMLSQGVDVADVAPDPFWENLFPGLANSVDYGGTGFTATQVAYDQFYWDHPDTSVVPWLIDIYGWPAYMNCSSGVDMDLSGGGGPPLDGLPDCPFAFFDDQFAALSVWSSIAKSSYNAFAFTVRKRMSSGVDFTFNYTLSKALDHSSTPERQGSYGGIAGGQGGYTGFLINSWNPDLNYSFADYDMRHQINANWIVELPFGRGKALASDVSGVANQIIGGWTLSGLMRWNTGLPANVINDRVWPTNWNVQGNAVCAAAGVDAQNNFLDIYSTTYGPCPATQNVHNAVTGGPNMFANPEEAITHFRYGIPGEAGNRNLIRGDGYFTVDFGVNKSFTMPWENHRLEFSWQIFNLTNSVYFDPWSATLDIGSAASFGNYTDTVGNPRLMQFGLRYEF